MVNAIGTSNINPIQMFNAVNAFKGAESINESKVPETSEGIDINDDSLLKTQDTEDIRKFAKIVGEDNLSDEDIRYGITYGRSVIADYMI